MVRLLSWHKIEVTLLVVCVWLAGLAEAQARQVREPREQKTQSKSVDTTPLAQHWLDEANEAPRVEPARSSAALAWGVVVVMVAGILGRSIIQKKQWWPSGGLQKESKQLAVIAQRWLGGGQSLVLVEVEGERLLLAKSVNETTLLSHLPQHVEEPVAQQAFDRADNEHIAEKRKTRRPDEAVGQGTSQEHTKGRMAEPLYASGPQLAWPSDLQGLAQWQARAAQQNGVER